MQREVVAKHLKSPDHCDRAGSSPAPGTKNFSRHDAIDALDALPETRDTDWYKRLVEAAEAATQAELIAAGSIETH